MPHQRLQSERFPRSGNGRRPPGELNESHFLFLCLCGVAFILFRGPLGALANLAFHDDRYTYVLAVPFVSIALLWLERREIFTDARSCPWLGIPFVLVGLTLCTITCTSRLDGNYALSVRVPAIVVVCLASFVWSYGVQAARAALFPLAFLFLMVPIPSVLLNPVVTGLQRASAETAFRLFKLTGVPVSRIGAFQFALPGVTIEVAQECSGIRSSVSLFMSSIVAGYLFLQSNRSRAIFSVLTIPIVIFKNALRIVTISSLGVYVDPGFLHGRLHRYGGLPFSVLALLLLVPVFAALTRTERHHEVNHAG